MTVEHMSMAEID